MANRNGLFSTGDLGGGFRLHLHRTKAFKTVAARLVLHADLDARCAARAVVPRVLNRGTRRLPSLRDFQIELDRLYGAALVADVRKLGERQLIQFRGDWVTDRLAGEPLLDRMAALLAEVLHEPARDDDEGLRSAVVEQEKKLLADEVESIFDDKARYAQRRLLEEMCKREPYARPATGRAEEIRALGVDEVRDAHEDLLARAPADLFLVGDLTWSRALRFAKRLELHGGRRPARLRRTTRRRPTRVRTVREAHPVGQAKLAMGFRTTVRPGGRLYPALVLMNALFGGTPVGKLFKVVREQASLCYAIQSVAEATKGLVLVHAGIDEKDYARARRLIARQLADLQAGRVGEEETEQAREILRSSLRSMHDSPGGLINFALEGAVNGLSVDLERLGADLGSVTMRDVARAARTIELDTVYLLRNESA